jgi:hypothetical protein
MNRFNQTCAIFQAVRIPIRILSVCGCKKMVKSLRSLALVFLAALQCEGRVEVLRTDTFDVATREGFWLVEFYAPW